MTQGETQVKNFTEDYIEQCFTIWYSMGQPTSMTLFQESLPEPPSGKKPSKEFLRQMRDTYGWVERADGMNALAIQKVEHQLIDQKATMLKRQAEQALEIANLARDHLVEHGFDTSASAVNALFKATEEERTVRGVSDMMIKISKMTPEELMQEAAKLLKRNSEVIDGETEEYADSDSDPT